MNSLRVGHNSTFQLRIVADERFFWILLIQEQDDIVELRDLEPKMNTDLMQLAATLGKRIQRATVVTKINTATIGNVVHQFHLHEIARHTDDEAGQLLSGVTARLSNFRRKQRLGGWPFSRSF